ncbi:hypothetical protein ACP70R_042174 [Stipagrostis hirtigluma subsp. patula]
MAADGEGNREKSPFRWLDAARYVVAAVVTVLIVAVIVNAIKVVLRPDSLSFSVLRGSVFARRIQQPPTLLFDLNIRANNPSGRARMYYVNLTAYLFDRSTPAWSPDPRRDSFLYFRLQDKAVQQQGRVDTMKQVNGTRGVSMEESYFDMLYNATLGDVTMRLEGSIITEIRSGFNTTPHWITYYCRPLVVGGDPDDEAFQDMPDVPCREVQAQNIS